MSAGTTKTKYSSRLVVEKNSCNAACLPLEKEKNDENIFSLRLMFRMIFYIIYTNKLRAQKKDDND